MSVKQLTLLGFHPSVKTAVTITRNANKTTDILYITQMQPKGIHDDRSSFSMLTELQKIKELRMA